MSRKLKRYHREIYFPDWSENSLKEFCGLVFRKRMVVFSVHAVEKIVGYSFKYGQQLLKFLLKSVRNRNVDISQIFEFYSYDEEIKKICIRHSFDKFPVDLVFVVSLDGTIITVFTINKDDHHSTINSKLYEKEKK